MPWGSALAEDIWAQFAMLEGCLDRDTDLLPTWSGRTDEEKARRVEWKRSNRGQLSIAMNENKRKSKKRQYENLRQKFNRRQNNDMAKNKRAQNNAGKRRRNEAAKLRAWLEDAKLICIGREIPPEQWLGVLQSPMSEAEIEARKDFVHFTLRKVKNGAVAKVVARMLGISEADVRAIAAERGLVA